MQSIWWNVALRDVLGPLGYLALMVLILALLHVAGTRQPREELGRARGQRVAGRLVWRPRHRFFDACGAT